jgi:hypothetical protein
MLELLIPKLLRRDHSEWKYESIDGFYFSTALKTAADSCSLAGMCILITDQTITPLALDMSLTDSATFKSLRVRLGEAGGGRLGISGPVCTSPAAKAMLASLDHRLASVKWVYDVSM